MKTPSSLLEHAIRSPKRGNVAIMPYLTAGYPNKEDFCQLLQAVSVEADAIELGVPFSDPMADGATIQGSSEVALANGVSVRWILEMLASCGPLQAPVVLMSYLNPLLAYGLRNLVRDAAEVGVHGFIIPDLPDEEGGQLDQLCEDAGLARIQLVTPVTSSDRLRRLCHRSGGFVYAVTVTGTTGGKLDIGQVSAYLDRVRKVSPKPVCAGFGIAERSDVQALEGHAEGVIVGSALIRALGRGEDGALFVRALVQD